MSILGPPACSIAVALSARAWLSAASGREGGIATRGGYLASWRRSAQLRTGWRALMGFRYTFTALVRPAFAPWFISTCSVAHGYAGAGGEKK